MLLKVGILSALACVGLSTPLAAEEHYVLMMGDGYFPAHPRPDVGDTIRFINISEMPMTATALDGSWDTGVLAPRAEYVLIVRDKMKRAFRNFAPEVADADGTLIRLGAQGSIDYRAPEQSALNAARPLY